MLEFDDDRYVMYSGVASNGTLKKSYILFVKNNDSQPLPLENYNQEGALVYVVLTLTFYALSIIAMIAGLVKKKRTWQMDAEATEYLRNVDDVRKRGRNECLQKLVMNMPVERFIVVRDYNRASGTPGKKTTQIDDDSEEKPLTAGDEIPVIFEEDETKNEPQKQRNEKSAHRQSVSEVLAEFSFNRRHAPIPASRQGGAGYESRGTYRRGDMSQDQDVNWNMISDSSII